MLDLSLAELALIAVVGLLVIGPKEIPTVLRTVSGWVRQLRGLTHEVRHSFDEMMEESGVRESMNEIEEEARYIIDQNGEYQRVYDITEELKSAGKKEGRQHE
ncbi:MAG: twin-arginine translocase subunit TatB [Ketobacter sp.]|nr:twin-arginine translocase subunit TatB [Ketobacter sp.]